MIRLLKISKLFQKTAGCLIIGNEILSGDTLDTNSNFLAEFLYDNGVLLKEMRVIEDCVETIERHILDISPQYDFIFTSGGIGSTHDDVTYESIASAFGVGLEINPSVEEKIRSIIPENRICDAIFRMATLPVSCELFFHEEYFCPLAKIENVFILPGVSLIFRELLECNKDLFYDPDHLRICREVGTNLPESLISDPLRKIASKNEYEGIEIGSYPIGRKRREGEINVRIRVSSFQYRKDDIDSCVNEILENIDCVEIFH